MKILKIVGILLAVYVGIVVLFAGFGIFKAGNLADGKKQTEHRSYTSGWRVQAGISDFPRSLTLCAMFYALCVSYSESNLSL